MSTPTIDTNINAPVSESADAEFDLDIRIFESGIELDEIIRMTDDNCGTTCQSACTSC